MMVASVGLRKCGLWPVLPSPAGVKPRRSVWSLLCPFRRSPRFAVRRRTLLGPLPRPFACHDRAHIRPSCRPHRPLHVPSPSRLLLLSPRCLRVAPDRSLARRPRLGPAGGFCAHLERCELFLAVGQKAAHRSLHCRFDTKFWLGWLARPRLAEKVVLVLLVRRAFRMAAFLRVVGGA